MAGPVGSDRAVGQRLLDRGVAAWPIGDRIEVQVQSPQTLDLIRDVVVDLDLGLVRIQEVHHTLEEVFAQSGGVQ